MKKGYWVLLSFLLAGGFLMLVLAGPDQASSAFAAPLTPEQQERAAEKMDAELLAHLQNSATNQTLTAIVYLKAQPKLDAMPRLNSKEEQTAVTLSTLQTFGEIHQQAIRVTLDTARQDGRLLSYRPYFIFNGLAVTAQPDLIWELALREDVASIGANHLFTIQSLSKMENTSGLPSSEVFSRFEFSGLTAEPNILQINADDVWSQYDVTGEGILVANMDTGVQYDHPALVNQYAGNNNGSFDHDFHWFDATEIAANTPYDDNAHGTHTMGTIVGGDGLGPSADDIGVAPDAQWIAVKIFDANGTATTDDIHRGFEWLLAPCPIGVEPGSPSCDPSKAPDVVNNSWGNNNGALLEFVPDVAALRAAGIWPEFSAGNSGPGLGTVVSPASYAESFATGAVDSSDVIASFSSRGPSPLTDEIKPDVVAPGVDIRSAVPGNGYDLFNGTSMAGPHSVGVAALMLQAAPGLDLDTLEQIMRETAVDLGDPGPDTVYGYGRIDALRAVQRLIDAGTLSGSVQDSTTNRPIASATVRLVGADLDVTTLTDEAGNYQIDYLVSGTYTLMASFYGYNSATVTNISIAANSETVQNIVLDPLPTYLINGQITNAETAEPIEGALITIRDTPLAPALSDSDGNYQIEVAEGTAVVEAAAFGFATGVVSAAVTAPITLDFTLTPLPPILLVDDDEGAAKIYSPHVETAYFAALDANGFNYTYWDIEVDGSPDFDTIRQYNAVVWFGGEYGRVKEISDAAQAQALMDYLDLGGQLFYISQSHTFYFGEDSVCDSPRWGGEGPCLFAQAYLGVADWIEDQKGKVAYGVSGNPVGDGFGPIPLTYPPFVADLTDHITPTLSASLAFTVTDTIPEDDVNWTTTTVFSPTSGAKTVFMAAPLEAMPAPDAADVMVAVMSWFDVQGLSEGVTAAPQKQSAAAFAGETVSYTVRLRNLNAASDTFDLSVISAPWPTTIWDAAFTTQIDQVGPVLPGETADFGIQVVVSGSSLPGDEAVSRVQATSQGGTPYTVVAQVTTQAKMSYFMRDSDTCGSGATYDWVDALAGDRFLLDEGNNKPLFVQIPLPEPFIFYNETYDHLYVNDHATILFGDDNFYTDRFPSGTPPIPNPTLLDPNGAVYIGWGTSYWHPSDEDPAAGVYSQHVTENGRNWFVITYYKYPNFIAGSDDTMQVIFDLDRYEITVQYQTFTHSLATVVGIESPTGTEGILYVDRQQPEENVLHDELAIQFGVGAVPSVTAVRLDPAIDSAVVPESGVVDYVLTLTNESDSIDSYDLTALGNMWPVTFYDADFSQPISELSSVAPCEPIDIGVRVKMPTDGALQDLAIIQARSKTDTLVVATAVLTSKQAAHTYFFPFVEISK